MFVPCQFLPSCGIPESVSLCFACPLEGPFDLIIFNPPWVPRALDHDAAENDVVFGNDYPPKLFEKLFEEVPKALEAIGSRNQ